MGKIEFPHLSVYRNGNCLIRYRFTGKSTRSDQTAQQAERPWFLRASTEKSKSGNMQNYVLAPGCLFNSETEEATTDRSYGRSALLAFVRNC
jgi:hypothetical protein